MDFLHMYHRKYSRRKLCRVRSDLLVLGLLSALVCMAYSLHSWSGLSKVLLLSTRSNINKPWWVSWKNGAPGNFVPSETTPVLDGETMVKLIQTPCDTPRQMKFSGQMQRLTWDPICRWLQHSDFLANGSFIQLDREMALLRDVILDPRQQPVLGPRGGEKMDRVMGQNEAIEYLKLKEGFFTLQCASKPSVSFTGTSHLDQWVTSIRCVRSLQSLAFTKPVKTMPDLTIAVQRYEYANLYHTITDLFNVFLTMVMLNQHPDNVTVLWMDAHPSGDLDTVWSTLFGRVVRAGRLLVPVYFPTMAWATIGYNSPLSNHEALKVSYLEEFRSFFLNRHNIESKSPLDCSSLTFLIVWRRDYVAHPRNKAGTIQRKIDNEDELVKEIIKVLPKNDAVLDMQLDRFPMTIQLLAASRADVLIGMHGAGLTHTLFQPPHGGLIELFPQYWSPENRHFAAMARWRGLHYVTWQNGDPKNEKGNGRTYIPPHVVGEMVKKMRDKMCG